MRKFVFLAISLLIMSCSNMDDMSQNLNPEDTANRDAILSISDTGSVVTTETATQVAKNMLGKPESRSSEEVSVEPMLDETGKEIAYVVNYGTNDGYVVVNANKQLSPVLAYSETGHFDAEQAKGTPAAEWIAHMATMPTENMPDSIAASIASEWANYSDNTQTAISQLSSGIITDSESVNNQLWELEENGWEIYEANYWIANHVNLEYLEGLETEVDKWNIPITWANDINGKELCFVIVKRTSSSSPSSMTPMKTEWGQNNPYNSSVPNSYLLGSQTIAIGQILKYLGVSTTGYNLSSMPNVATSGTQGNIGAFLYSLAKNLNTIFGVNYSYATFANMKSTLTNYGCSYSTPTFSQSSISASINGNKPVIIEGSSSTGSTGAWVADAYRSSHYHATYQLIVPGGTPDDAGGPLFCQKSWEMGNGVTYFHMNWGESGKNNGYYRYDYCIDKDYSPNLRAITQIIK